MISAKFRKRWGRLYSLQDCFWLCKAGMIGFVQAQRGLDPRVRAGSECQVMMGRRLHNWPFPLRIFDAFFHLRAIKLESRPIRSNPAHDLMDCLNFLEKQCELDLGLQWSLIIGKPEQVIIRLTFFSRLFFEKKVQKLWIPIESGQEITCRVILSQVPKQNSRDLEEIFFDGATFDWRHQLRTP